MTGFLPHGVCFAGRPDLIWLHVASDAIVAIAYFMIPLTLVYFIRRQKASLSFNWAISLFAAFILLCGTGHVWDILTIWSPVYYWQGLWKAATAVVSLVTAIALLALIPRLLSMRTPEELEAANQKLALTNARLEETNQQLQLEVKARLTAEQELRQSLVEVQRSAQELEQFAYIASHDLQAPLRNIAGFSQLLERRYQTQLGDEGAEFLGFIRQGVGNMQALIDALLQLSRVGRGKDARMESQPLELTLKRALSALETETTAAKARIEISPLPTITADHRLLTQLFQNLIANAIKFQAAGVVPEVNVSALEQGDDWLLTVSDNGIGIPKDQQEAIFAIFRRLHGQDEFEGSGIGLAICRKIAVHHGGSIWAESDGEGSGSRFILRLPKTPPHKEAPVTALPDAK